MKKIFCVFISLLLLCSCTLPEDNFENAEREKIIGVWISCYELNSMLSSGDFKNQFNTVADNISSFGITDAFVHVRGFGDSLFISDFYPQNEAAKQYDFDVLEFMIETLKEKSIRFHAWINPFRKADGAFNNPADTATVSAVLGGIREIIDKYSVSGIHFDDYFYPANNTEIDADTYTAYLAATQSPLTLEEYRLSVINSFVLLAKDAVKLKNKDIIFSISPAADIDKNKTSAFADVEYWCKTGVIDYIIPQLYFGYDYPDENFRFSNLLSRWQNTKRADNTKLLIGLAAYKTGTDQQPDNKEWQNDSVLSRQTADCIKNDNISGVCFFSYTYLFAQDELHKSALKNAKGELAAS
ncbi:MAG: family 10 glycosylhydrolase [Clostridia bacterium]|nr:family 10 glycosylhydrolase [Clostridia bacterium]